MIHYYKGEWTETLKLEGDEPFLLWGMSSFTSFVWEGGVCAPDLHFKRLVEGASFLGMDKPSYELFLSVLNEVQKKAEELRVFAKVRMAWVQGVEGCFFWVRLSITSESIVKAEQKSKRLGVYSLSREEYENPIRCFKVGNYGHHRKSFAKKGDGDDSILLYSGEVVEASMASIIVLNNDVVYVSKSQSRLESIAEHQLINFLKYKYIVQVGIDMNGLLERSTSRWYYCNSLQGVVAISEISGRKLAENEKELSFLKEIAFFSKKQTKTLVSSSQLSIIDLTEVARD